MSQLSDDLDCLGALARAATPGPWTHDTGKWDENDVTSPDLVCAKSIGWSNVASCYQSEAMEPGQDHRNAAYIAAVSPEVVLRLIERLRHLERALEAAEFGQAHTGWPCPGCAECEPA